MSYTHSKNLNITMFTKSSRSLLAAPKENIIASIITRVGVLFPKHVELFILVIRR